MVTGGINSDPYFGLTEAIFFGVTFVLLAYYLPILITLLVLGPLGFKIYTKLTSAFCRSYKRLDGKTTIVTGGNIGIGLETAKDLAYRGARVVIACRSLDRGKKALDEIVNETGNQNVVLKQLDLSSLTSVRKFCTEINTEESRLDILVNNAGLAVSSKEVTEDGMELCMQTNHFGPFLLTNLLLDLMQKSGKARIVNVASDAHKIPKVFDPENLNSEKVFSVTQVYGFSKLANIYFTSELHRRLKDAGISGITVNCLHPGVVRSAILVNHANENWQMKILSPMWNFFGKTSFEGAQTSILLSVSDEVEGVSGEYFVECKKASPTKLAQNAENAKTLWEKSVKFVKLQKEETILPIKNLVNLLVTSYSEK